MKAGRLPDLLPFFGAICAGPRDDAETWTRKAHFTLAMILIVPAGFIWGLLYLAFGASFAAMSPLAYSVLSLINLLVLRETRRFRFFQVTQLALILILPFALQLALGGFVSGSAVVLWSFLCPLLAVLFTSPREAAIWFLAFLVAVLAAAILQPSLEWSGELPAWLVWSLFTMNIAAVSAMTFATLMSFVRARERLRQLEIAYLEQNVMLRQREKLATLGTLAAGVAHELNNPAAAVRRSADQLLPNITRLTRSGAALSSFAGLAERCESILKQAVGATAPGTPLEISAKEDELEEWLADHDVERSWEVAPALVAIGYDTTEVAQAVAGVEPERIGKAVEFLAEAATATQLGEGIGEGARRISEIVAALRSYSYLDRGTWQTVDIREGLESTLILLKAKLRDMRIERNYAEDLPRIEVRGNELNQVWTNIIDNAVDATEGKGALRLRTFRAGDHLVVEFEDDGPGMTPGVAEKVFDPFFTTKPPGSGTGLGLNISYNIVVRQHSGQISVVSEPGRTCFRIELPLTQSKAEELAEDGRPVEQSP